MTSQGYYAARCGSSRFRRTAAAVAAIAAFIAGTIGLPPLYARAETAAKPAQGHHYYLPDANAAKVVSVAKTGIPEASITIMTERVAVKETGPADTIRKFGEVYAFSPAFAAAHRDEPTLISFWNLQPDDDHDFMMYDPSGNVLMHLELKPLTRTRYIFTFHKAGLYNFSCALHQPEMNGQILVIEPDKTP